jgi:YidC/Oxa1 family membrane protein insertase
MWNAFVNLLFEVLQQIYSVVGDWGLAIIVLTVALRLLMTPLVIKQTRSTYELQKHQPKMKQIQEKYKDNKELQTQKLQEFYAEHKINPFASCLPMLLQMPLFVALYQMLAAATEKADGGPLAQYLASNSGTGSFFGIIPDIMVSASSVFNGDGWVAAIPYIILLLLFSLSIYIPQLITPGEKTQKTVGMYMAVFMLVIGWSTPAGVLLYWDTSSIIGIGQQWFTQQAMKKTMEDEDSSPALPSGKKKKK